VLLSAATIYMDYLRDAAMIEVHRNNARDLEQTQIQTRGRQIRMLEQEKAYKRRRSHHLPRRHIQTRSTPSIMLRCLR
jgi:hypothetical protein